MAGNELSEDQERFFVDTSREFLLSCDASQVQLAPEKFAEICRKFTELMVAKGRARIAIAPLRSAVQRSRPSPNALTPAHPLLLQCCLLGKFYGLAEDHLYPQGTMRAQFKCLDVVDPKTTGLVVKDFFLYCYYGGMTLVGLKRYSEALDFFLRAFAVPATQVSAIVVASYKKYLLVSLLLHGQGEKPPSLYPSISVCVGVCASRKTDLFFLNRFVVLSVCPIPEYTSQVVQRSIGSWCSEYLEVAKAFSTYEVGKLEQALEKHRSVLEADKNFGLGKQLIPSLSKRVIQRLTQTYLTLSLDDLAVKGGVVDAQAVLLEMIEKGEIHAKISQKDKMVAFPEDGDARVRDLSGGIDLAIDLGAEVESLDESLMTNRTFLQHHVTS